MKKAINRILVIFICMTLIIESQTVNVWAEEINSSDEILLKTAYEGETDTSKTSSSLESIEDEELKDNTLLYSVDSDENKTDLLSTTDFDLNIESPDNAIEVGGTDSLGTMLSSVITDKTREQDENNGFNIFSVEINEKTATVEFETVKDAELVVAVYEEDGIEQLASGKTSVTSKDTTTTITIDIDVMPQYYYVRAYLVMSDTLEPLCKVYESPNYTKEMQDFFAKTTDDFDSNRVYNLDEDKTENFLVYNDEVIRIKEDRKENILTFADDSKNCYTFENSNEVIKGLRTGDVFSYEQNDGTLRIIEVESVDETEDTKITVRGKDTSLEEVFDFVRIDLDTDSDDINIDNSKLQDGVTYLGMMDDDELGGYVNNGSNENIVDISNDSFSGEGNLDLSATYKIDKGDDIKVSGSVGLKFGGSIKFYVTLTYQYAEVKLDYELNSKIKVSAKSSLIKIELGRFDMSPMLGVFIHFTPSFVIEVSGGLEAKYSIKGTVGKSFDSDSGWTDLTSSPKTNSEVKGEVDVFVGISFEPEVTVLSDKIASAKMSLLLGVEFKGKQSIYTSSTKRIHLCYDCIDGDVIGKIEGSIGISFLRLKSLTYESKISLELKFADFYYSNDRKEFGWGDCPYTAYKVTFHVIDSKGANVSEAVIEVPQNFTVLESGSNTITDHIKTDVNGKAIGYLPVGKYVASIKADKKQNRIIDFTVINESKNVDVIVYDKGTNISEELPFYSDKIGLGVASSAVIKDGSLWVWGDNSYGQLGDGTTISKSVPTRVMDDVKCISLGGQGTAVSCSTAILKKNGELYLCGEANWNEFGDEIKYRAYPYKFLENVKYISNGCLFEAALKEDGSLWTWGCNNHGELGDGTTTNKSTPIKILDNVRYVSCGGFHGAAIKNDGSLWMWGDVGNGYGLLGNGTTTGSLVPIKIMEGVKQVSCGHTHTAVIKEDNSLWTWGQKWQGQLGDGTATGNINGDNVECRTVPYKVLDDAAYVCLGVSYSAAIKNDGSLWMWGDNYAGQLGDNTTDISLVPFKVMDNVESVGLGGSHTAVIKNDGSLWMWGNNSTDNSLYPIKIMDKSRKEISINSYSDNTASYASVAEKNENNNEILLNDKTLTESKVDFTGLKEDTIYNFYILGNQEVEDKLSALNLIYINQGISDSTGQLSFDYLTSRMINHASVFVVKQYEESEAIQENNIVITDLQIFPENMYIAVGENTGISTRIIPNNASNQELIWESSNETVATVSNGIVTGVSEGTVVIKALTGDGSNLKAQCTIKVVGKSKNSGLNIKTNVDGLQYNGGAAVMPDYLEVLDGEVLLVANKDYFLTYRNNKNTYTLSEGDANFNPQKAPSITINGKGNYKGKEIVYFKILPLNISSEDFEADDIELAASNKKQKIPSELYWNGKVLKNGMDYKFAIYKTEDVGRTNSLGSTVKDAGDYVIRYTGINNFTGTREVSLKVSSEHIPVGKLAVGNIKDVKYTGSEIKPDPIVKDGRNLLVKDTHYTLSYKSNVEVGTGYVFINGIPENGYSGTKRVAFRITGTSIKNAFINGIPKAVTYTGSEIVYGADVLKLYLKAGSKSPQIDLVHGRDYSVSYSDNINAGKATITINGTGGYTKGVTKTFRINPYDISLESDIEGRFVIDCGATAEYSKGGAKPKIIASFKNSDGTIQMLTEGKDYTITYKHNKVVGGARKPMAVVNGKGNFKGMRTCEFKVITKDISTVMLNATDKVYVNKANSYSTKVSLLDTDGKELKAGTDYDKRLVYTYLNATEVKVNGVDQTRVAGEVVSTKDIIPAGTTIQVTAIAKGNYKNKVSGTYRITKSSMTLAKVDGIAAQIYTGKPITLDPSMLTVKIKNSKLSPYDEITGEGDFIIKEYINNTKTGTASVILQGVGNYGDTKTVKFSIKAKGLRWWWR